VGVSGICANTSSRTITCSNYCDANCHTATVVHRDQHTQTIVHPYRHCDQHTQTIVHPYRHCNQHRSTYANSNGDTVADGHGSLDRNSQTNPAPGQ
jgi:hypothetical protein